MRVLFVLEFFTLAQANRHTGTHTQTDTEIVKIEFYQILPPAEKGQA